MRGRPPPTPGNRLRDAATRRPWLVCLFACALWFAATLALRPLAIPDEGRYVGVAWEMLRTGHWAVPTLDGMPFFHKPPLFYWITATAMKVFGPGVAAARTAPWLAALATTTGSYMFLSRWAGRDAAWRTALVLATMPLFYGGSQYANLDMLVAACIAITLMLAAHATLAREAGLPFRACLALAFAAAAAGVLSKGLIGAVLPTLVLLTWGLLTRRFWRVARLLAWLPGWGVFAALAAPWFILMQARFPDFFHYFFVVQQFDRFQATGFNNPQPIWFYGAVLMLLTLPWSPWLLALGFGRRLLPPPDTGHARDLRLLMLAWLALITAFFSTPDSKLIGYILPVLVPLAVLVAACVPVGRSRWLFATAAVAALICVGGTVSAHFGQPKSRAALSARLAAAHRPDEPVYFLANYYYDVAFYARLRAPVHVVDAWTREALADDSWRRELVDAEGFAAPGSISVRLYPAELAGAVCRSPGAWIAGPSPAPSLAPFEPAWLGAATLVYQDEETALWHVDPNQAATRRALACDTLAPPRPLRP